MNFWKNATAYSRLIKLEHTLFALPFALSALCLSYKEGFSLGFDLVLLAIFAFTAARSAAMGFNRIVDAKFDIKNPRTKSRPSVNGEISLSAAKIFTGVSILLFILFAWLINNLCGILSIPAIVVLLGYSYAKRFTSAAHYILGLALSLAPAGAWIAATGNFDPRIISLSSALFFSISAFDIIYALQDMDFDKKENLHSIPARFGTRNSIFIAGTSFICAVSMYLITGLLFKLNEIYFLSITIIACLYIYGLFAVAKNGANSVNLAFLRINIASSFLTLFGIASSLF